MSIKNNKLTIFVKKINLFVQMNRFFYFNVNMAIIWCFVRSIEYITSSMVDLNPAVIDF